ncbi:tubulin-tyrosine ligase family-domain-containing protein [Tribonema minus]|uniref:Tubulin-tyrosine ligase family-domain-containing protein n=1 Tax=Tribonema minus TaxID=303371 RepID=A0A835ZQ42_9STRA|nr:tubulin-tyrosine ligase family-domain-containing protein [Tribonema minus]
MSLDERLVIEPTEKYSVISVQGSTDEGGDVSYVALDVLCPYTASLVHKAFARRRKRWRVTNDSSKAQLHWGDYECLNWDEIVSGRVCGSSYCTRKGLSRKAQLSMYTNKYLSKVPTSPLKKAMPRTIIVDIWEAFDDKMTFNLGGDIASFGDDAGVRQCMSLSDRIDWALEAVRDAMAAAEARGGWILKASTLNKGAGVHLVTDFNDLRDVVHANHDIREWVLQEYIERPLLVHGRKFHLRAYVLAVGCLSVYLFDRVLLLSAHAPYAAGDFSDPLAHITNTARQCETAAFDEAASVGLLSDLATHLTRDGGMADGDAEAAVTGIVTAMRAITAELFRAFKGEFAVFAPLPHCFEHFGLDFMVDEALNVWLLEANPGPDFKQTGARLKPVIEQLMEDTARVCVDGEQCLAVGQAVGGLVLVYEEQWSGSKGTPTMRMI